MDTAIIEKLRLLGLDTELRPRIKMKRMSRFYFSLPSNPAEQLFAFVSVAVWLARRAGADLEWPREEDDPNSTIASILEVLRSKGVSIDFSPHKLKQGYGEQVQLILNKLADDVLKKEDFQWKKADLTQVEDETADEDQIEDQTEVMLDQLEEDIGLYSGDSDNEGYVDSGAEEKNQQKSPVDIEQWKLELERVSPALRLKITADGLDWRARHAQMKAFREELSSRARSPWPQLDRVRSAIARCLDKTTTREGTLNGQMSAAVREYGLLVEELGRRKAENEELNSLISEKQEALNELNARLESVKQKAETRGNSMNDTAPLVSAKKALATLKKDSSDLQYQLIILLWLGM